jgi:hypothetical protein
MGKARNETCRSCGHLRSRHASDLNCNGRRSCGPSGTFKCRCDCYVPRRAALAADPEPRGKG